MVFEGGVNVVVTNANFNSANLNNDGTYDHKPHIRVVILIEEIILDMGFVVVRAVVVEIRAVEVGVGDDHVHVPLENHWKREPRSSSANHAKQVALVTPA